ncbi:hypothetical protein VOLCADRAFT_94533 [Volvox carteri f. nagariensis]|uniref:Nucleotide-diphospho-sugar transferase domain-containing protein n=1 Tax=Volvox carteri f. nagariensis TaxID=3068 RepID=D8U516_VOLCA|nr:uncharacterized protein VOLCADRAFT_94533 [Volvox carteri f. nagariensis]EFJ45068.1 hypothetical protein VOLCADRAFT_94533 [Volvox carteri f. nagariensis]|eukprot:XP_002953744.1 hypothetical protein VOLCADRAFT_94533 [Volvox carteri f. nagariensis]
MTRAFVQRFTRDNTVLITAMDKLVWKTFGPSYVENIQAANITYWLIAALDPETSLTLGELGITNCFNAPTERLKYTGTDANYHWGSHHWSQTTWNKVHIVKAVYEMGFHVIHSDADVVWFRDPLQFFLSQLTGPAHIIISVDALSTHNPPGEVDVEFASNPYTNINTGIYFVRQWPGGLAFFNDVWLPMQDKNIGHDQDGFNWVVRGGFFRQEIPGYAYIPPDTSLRVFYAAYSNSTAVAFLPPSMFGNTYTYVNARLWQRLNHTLYAVHWVWGGRTMESKRQDMRDAMKFHDEPEYYSSPYLLTFDVDQIPMPQDYNSWSDTEEMIRFHVTAANHQLQQAYYAFAAALIANRTLVIPRFLCYCSKNWYQTQRCRINEETVTVFPFTCSLSQLLRSKRLSNGFALPPKNLEYAGHKVFIREYSFLENPKVPDLIKTSFLEIVPSDSPRNHGPLQPDQLVLSEGPATRGYGRRITVPPQLSDRELWAVLQRYPRARIVHLPSPTRVLSGFSRISTWGQFDDEIQKVVAYWCCRTPPDMRAMNLTDKIQLVALPPNRYRNLPEIKNSNYLHQLGPFTRPQ